VQWDGKKWLKTSETLEPIKSKVMPLIEVAAKEYVKEIPGGRSGARLATNHSN
jgi:hypothetical protein